MNQPEPAVLIIAPRPGYLRCALEPVLGEDGCAALEAELLAATERWSNETAPGNVHLLEENSDADGSASSGAAGLDPALGQAAELFAAGKRPLLIVRPVVPRLRRLHAAAAFADLQDGCELVLGPRVDGGWYLIGIGAERPELLGLARSAAAPGDVIATGAAVAQQAGVALGILRAERPLQRPADVRAALADPLLPEVFERILRRGA